MTRTIHCPRCGVVLNVPESAAGKKLKCPQCATKFAAPSDFGPADSAVAGSVPPSGTHPAPRRPASSGNFGLPTSRGSSGSVELPASGRGSSGDFDLPSSPAPLRETFDLPLLGEDLPAPAPAQAKAPAGGDALALFQDDPKPRKVTGAEARSKARRCPSCGGVVPIGMSLCGTCGLDLDTGKRIAPLDVFEDEMPAPARSEAASLGLLFVGGLSATVNLILAVASLLDWSKGNGLGGLMLSVVWVFGIFASVQFLRRKSIRPLFVALGLGTAIGGVYLIALPIWEANVGIDVANPNAIAPEQPVDPDNPDATPARNIAEQINMQKIGWGVGLLLAYAAVSVYLNSPAMRREFTRK